LEGEDSLCIEKGETLGLGVDTYTRRGYNRQKGAEGAQVVNPTPFNFRAHQDKAMAILVMSIKMSCFHALQMWMIPRRYGTSSKIYMILTTQLNNLLLEKKLYSLHIQRQLMFQISLRRLRRS
jgi:hypothetical protein